MKPHYSSIMGAEGSHWVRQNLLEGQQDLVVEATNQITMSPKGKKKRNRQSPGEE